MRNWIIPWQYAVTMRKQKKIVMDLVQEVSLLKAYDAGPLSVASIVESITPLVLNVARLNHMKDVGIQFR